MSRTFKVYSAIWAICFATFNIIAFARPTFINIFTGSFWIGYLFIDIAFAGQLCCSYIAFKDENLQKTFYNVSLILVSYIALVSMLIAGSLCMVIPFFPVWLSVVICVLVASISASIILVTCFVINVVSGIDNEIKTKTFAIKTLTADAEHLLSVAQSFELKKECEKVYENLRYSDPVSNDALSAIESQITVRFKEFENAICENSEKATSLGEELIILIEDRNTKCKLLKYNILKKAIMNKAV